MACRRHPAKPRSNQRRKEQMCATRIKLKFYLKCSRASTTRTTVESECTPVREMRTPSHVTIPLKFLWYTCRILLSIRIQLQYYLNVPLMSDMVWPCYGIQLFSVVAYFSQLRCTLNIFCSS